MKRFYSLLVLSVGIAATFILAFSISDTSYGLTLMEGVNAARGDGQPSRLFGDASIFTTIVNILLFIIGALSVIMLIIGGFRYVLSGGNASNVTAAKNTILYAIVGLVVAFLAYAIVSWVLTAVAPGGGVGSGFTDV